MALADFDLLPAASDPRLPAGYNTGGFNSDGSLAWASNITPGPTPSMPDAQGRYPWSAGYGTGAVPPPVPMVPRYPQQQINLNSLFGPATGGTRAPTNLLASQRSQPVQQAVNTAFATNTANQAQATQSLSDFVNELKASRGKVNEYGQQEQNAISRIYDPSGVEAQLADINRQQQAATTMGAQAAMGRATRANNARRITGGNSSYLDRLLAQDLSGIAVNAAGQGANQSRADLEYLTGLRSGNIGRRQSIIDSILNRDLAPVRVANEFQSANLGNLGQLANLEYGNNIYMAPEDAYTKRINFLRDLQAMGYGVPSEFNPIQRNSGVGMARFF